MLLRVKQTDRSQASFFTETVKVGQSRKILFEEVDKDLKLKHHQDDIWQILRLSCFQIIASLIKIFKTILYYLVFNLISKINGNLFISSLGI